MVVLDFAIGGVLLQEDYPIDFKSKKLNDAERHYITHGKDDCHDLFPKYMVSLFNGSTLYYQGE